MSKNTGGQAFPTYQFQQHGPAVPMGGMTLRDYFAAKAMQGMLADIQGLKSMASASGLEKESLVEVVAGFSYGIADAMIAAERVK